MIFVVLLKVFSFMYCLSCVSLINLIFLTLSSLSTINLVHTLLQLSFLLSICFYFDKCLTLIYLSNYWVYSIYAFTHKSCILFPQTSAVTYVMVNRSCEVHKHESFTFCSTQNVFLLSFHCQKYSIHIVELNLM